MIKHSKPIDWKDLDGKYVWVVESPESDYNLFYGKLQYDSVNEVINIDDWYDGWSFSIDEVDDVIMESGDIVITLLEPLGDSLTQKFWNSVDRILYHPAVDNFLYNPRVQLAYFRLGLMLGFFGCLILGWLEVALIITFSLVVSQWQSTDS